ncbi:hypothetical protein EJ05DRAFT_535868 [Pseudovirgaria hyperparasitica]|uniref:Centromere protein H C-terminal domain-containing protein n=1 Tax=Pseudovirgaria hyperparasitica TaxID=470096 RepID=A0A6A6WDU8_9PEZI|nr:uncharacterized protein EJ05DRAFT_535868 [Pseudovirgaria hyperparasitica]KAF2761002.1 hypothetical protein EJ05DRAFT_535868 [Pseudovirgaria hyperparasitica]
MDEPKLPSHNGFSDESRSYKDLTQTPNNDALVLSERERQALSLWDQTEELRIESALLEMRLSGQIPEPSNVSDDVLEQRLISVEREALAARSRYLLRNKIVHSVLVTDPVIKAVHGGPNTSTVERRLFPVINERDILSMIHGSLASQTVLTTSYVASAERDYAFLMQENRTIAQELLGLANDLKAQVPDEIQDAGLRKQAMEAQAELLSARKRWRVMKSVVAAMIVGSGINWADSEAMTALVLDDEGELG